MQGNRECAGDGQINVLQIKSGILHFTLLVDRGALHLEIEGPPHVHDIYLSSPVIHTFPFLHEEQLNQPPTKCIGTT
jgi:hypothetical protein